jgi:hypothetical protein
MKHKHRWQFVEEVKYPINAIENKDEKTKLIIPVFVFYDYYARFICECGKEREVKIK